MKKFGIAAAIMAAALAVVSVRTDCLSVNMTSMAAESDDVNMIEYNNMLFFHRVGKKNEVVLTHYFGTETDLVVPETVEGYTVTAVEGAFKNNKLNGVIIENVTLPDTINYISNAAFENSTVVSVNIPKNLKFIPSRTFYRCLDLATVKFHDDIIAIANSAFERTNITIPENLQRAVADDSKIKCENSKSKYIMKNEDFKFVIGTDADNGSIYCNINDYIGEDTDIVIPDNIYGGVVKKVDFSGFDASGITSVTFPETAADITVAHDSFSGSQITELNINSPCILNSDAFGNCKNLKEVRFNGDVKLDGAAFGGCTNLTSVEFKAGVDLKDYSFVDCYSLENINIDTSSPIMGNAFNGCMELTSINSEPAFDEKTGGFNPKYSDFIRSSFYMSEEVGFLNEYVKAQYKKIADEVTTPEMSDVEKVKALHDWVCANTTYATENINSPEFHTDGSILLNDSTVCEGYAKAMNLLCNYAGIETYYVHSSGHAWNIVKIGGHYFHVDSTWDDTGDVKSYANFMKSDSEIRGDGSHHSSWKAYIPTSLHSFQKEGTPECSYQIGDVNNDFEISAADLVKMNRVLLNAETETADNIVLYDMNFDGKTDVYDMILMRREVIEKN